MPAANDDTTAGCRVSSCGGRRVGGELGRDNGSGREITPEGVTPPIGSPHGLTEKAHSSTERVPVDCQSQSYSTLDSEKCALEVQVMAAKLAGLSLTVWTNDVTGTVAFYQK